MKTKTTFLTITLALLATVNSFSQSIAGGEAHSIFLCTDGTVRSVGDNAYGQLGDGTTIDKTTAIQVFGLTGISAVEAGTYHSVFLKNDGTVWACGRNTSSGI